MFLVVDCARHLAAVIAALLQETALVLFQNKAGQAAGSIGGSVNSDSIGTNLWGGCRRVAVHDQFAVLRLARQKRLADVEKIIAILPIEGDAGPDAGMAEEIIADCC